jgi:hypothetical protein
VLLPCGVETELRKTWRAMARTPIGFPFSEGWY